MRFKQQVALVTGGESGIGRAIARSFAKEGAFVYVTGRREDRLSETAEDINKGGGKARAIAADVANTDQVRRLMATIGQEHGGLDILINAATELRLGLVHDTSEEDFDLMFGINVRGLWLTSKLALPLLRGRRNANIIHISSLGATRADAGLGIYEASKSAVNTLTRVMAKELSRDRIRVNAIAPGPIDTKIFSGSPLGDDVTPRPFDMGEMMSSLPFGRAGTSEEIARLAVFLASPESDLISGSVTSIEGALGY